MKDHLDKKEISVVIGPRQAGKTTVLLRLKDFLASQNKNVLFLNLDIETDKQFFSSQEALLSKIRLEFGDEPGYVFIDEIQRKQNAGIFLKGIFDMNLRYKFIVSGSGSLELKEQIHESLTGRKRIFELNTVSFEEFINYKTGYKYEDRIKDFFKLDTIKSRELLSEYLQFGGYPRIILSDKLEDKKSVMDEIYQSYLIKDVSFLLGVRETESFTELVRVLSSQIGNMVNVSELSRTLGIAAQTIKRYLYYLEKTFILSRLTPFFNNIRKEITKSPVIYFNDLGLRNYSAGMWGNMRIENSGAVFENFVFNILKQRNYSDQKLHYWRTKDGAEVDFVIKNGQQLLPVEVKYMELKNSLMPRSFRQFISKFSPEEAWLINLGLNEELQLEKTRVRMMAFYGLL